MNFPVKNRPICRIRKKSLFKRLETYFLAYLWKVQCILHVCILEELNVCAHASSVCGVLDVGGALHKGRERERVSESERDLLQWLMGASVRRSQAPNTIMAPDWRSNRLVLHMGKRGARSSLPLTTQPGYFLSCTSLHIVHQEGRGRQKKWVSAAQQPLCVCVCVEAGSKAGSVRPAGSALSQGCASFSVLLNRVFKHTLTWVHFQWWPLWKRMCGH